MTTNQTPAEFFASAPPSVVARFEKFRTVADAWHQSEDPADLLALVAQLDDETPLRQAQALLARAVVHLAPKAAQEEAADACTAHFYNNPSARQAVRNLARFIDPENNLPSEDYALRTVIGINGDIHRLADLATAALVGPDYHSTDARPYVIARRRLANAIKESLGNPFSPLTRGASSPVVQGG